MSADAKVKPEEHERELQQLGIALQKAYALFPADDAAESEEVSVLDRKGTLWRRLRLQGREQRKAVLATLEAFRFVQIPVEMGSDLTYLPKGSAARLFMASAAGSLDSENASGSGFRF